MTSRRTFLRVLGSAAIAAVAPPILGTPAPLMDPPTYTTYAAAAPGVLTLEMLEAAYKACVIGPRQPTLLVTSRSVARRLGLVYDVEVSA